MRNAACLAALLGVIIWSSAEAATIRLAGTAQDFVAAGLMALGETYTTEAGMWATPGSADILIMSDDGGTETPVDYSAHLASGNHVLMIGGSNWSPYYSWLSGYLSHTGEIGWHQSDDCSSDWNVVGANDVTALLPAAYEFPNQAISFHMVHFTESQPAGTQLVGRTCHSGPDNYVYAVRTYPGGGTFSYMALDIGEYSGGTAQADFVNPMLEGYLQKVRCELDPADADGDGIPNSCDNCPAVANPGQEDTDGNGTGDACNSAEDADGDEWADALDNCPATPNPGQEDADGDGIGDVCDACIGNGAMDGDGDGYCDGADNCPTIANPGQEDGNGDGIGDACSPQVTITGITTGGGSVVASVAVSSPVGLGLSGQVIVGETSVSELTYTWLATSCSVDDLFELTINGVAVEAVDPDGPGLTCDCNPASGIQTHTVSLPGAFALLSPGVNQLGVRKSSQPSLNGTALSWAYATITIGGIPQQVDLFDQDGGGSIGNPSVCDSGYTFDSVDAGAPSPPVGAFVAQAWSGQLPCGIDISTLPAGSLTLVVTAADGVVGTPSVDSQDFAHAAESLLLINGGGCDDANACTVDQCNGGTGTCENDPGNAGLECRPAAGDCDVAEACDGVNPACPVDGFATAGDSCADDGQPCTDDECDGAGQCAHPAKPDTDGDSVCDEQDECTNLGGGRDFYPAKPKPRLVLTRINADTTAGNDGLRLSAAFDLPSATSFGSLNPLDHGARIVVLNQGGGVVLDQTLPGDAYGGKGTRGWKTNAKGTLWQYSDKTTAPLSGITTFKVTDKGKSSPGQVRASLSAKNGSFPVVAGDPPLEMIVVLGNQTDAMAGYCGESDFTAANCTFNSAQTTLTCKK